MVAVRILNINKGLLSVMVTNRVKKRNMMVVRMLSYFTVMMIDDNRAKKRSMVAVRILDKRLLELQLC